jgi:hypothetical protein
MVPRSASDNLVRLDNDVYNNRDLYNNQVGLFAAAIEDVSNVVQFRPIRRRFNGEYPTQW